MSQRRKSFNLENGAFNFPNYKLIKHLHIFYLIFTEAEKKKWKKTKHIQETKFSLIWGKKWFGWGNVGR